MVSFGSNTKNKNTPGKAPQTNKPTTKVAALAQAPPKSNVAPVKATVNKALAADDDDDDDYEDDSE